MTMCLITLWTGVVCRRWSVWCVTSARRWQPSVRPWTVWLSSEQLTSARSANCKTKRWLETITSNSQQGMTMWTGDSSTVTAVASAGNYHSQDLPVFSLLSTNLKKKRTMSLWFEFLRTMIIVECQAVQPVRMITESGVSPLSCSVSQLTETPAWLW